jgi:hypothetical protein
MVRLPGYRLGGLEFDSRRYQILWIAVSLERCPPSLVKINEELLESSGSGLGNRLAAVVFRRTDHATSLYPQKLALNFTDKWRSLSRYSSLAD